MKRGEICVWNKKRPDGSVSRILCTVANRTAKNIQILKWAPKIRMYVKAWASPESLTPATEREKRQYERLVLERRQRWKESGSVSSM